MTIHHPIETHPSSILPGLRLRSQGPAAEGLHGLEPDEPGVRLKKVSGKPDLRYVTSRPIEREREKMKCDNLLTIENWDLGVQRVQREGLGS